MKAIESSLRGGGEWLLMVTNGYRWLPMVTVPRRMVTVLGLRVVAWDRAFLHWLQRSTEISGKVSESKGKRPNKKTARVQAMFRGLKEVDGAERSPTPYLEAVELNGTFWNILELLGLGKEVPWA